MKQHADGLKYRVPVMLYTILLTGWPIFISRGGGFWYLPSLAHAIPHAGVFMSSAAPAPALRRSLQCLAMHLRRVGYPWSSELYPV